MEFDNLSNIELIEKIKELKTENNILKSKLDLINSDPINNFKQFFNIELIGNLGFWTYDRNTQILVASKGANFIYGLPDIDHPIDEILNIILPEFIPEYINNIKQLIEKNIEFDFIYKIKRKLDGKIVDIHSKAKYDSTKNMINGFIIDISEYKLIENDLFNKKIQLKEILENSIVANYKHDLLNHKYEYISPNIEKILGYSQYEFLQFNIDSIFELIHPDDKDKTNNVLKSKIERIDKDPIQIEYQIKHKNGNYIWFLDQFSIFYDSFNKPITIIGSVDDITERKLAEIALIESQNRYRLIADNTSDVIWILNVVKNKFSYVSPSIYKLRGFTAEEVMVQSIEQVMTDESYKNVQTLLAESLPKFINGELQTVTHVTFIDQPHKNGNIIHTEVTTNLVFNENNEVEIIGISRDISERKRREKLLIQSEEKYRAIFENIQDVYYEVDLLGNIIEVSPSIFLLSRGQYKREDLIGKELTGLYKNIEDRYKFLTIIKSEGFVNDYEIELLNKDGNTFMVSITSKIQMNKENQPEKIIGLMRDVTERTLYIKKQNDLNNQLMISNRIIEENLSQKNTLINELTIAKDKLETINNEKDKFFSIIAHDLKSPFNGFLGLTKFFAEQLTELTVAEMKEYSRSLQKAAVNLSKLLENLLEWSLIQRGIIEFNIERTNFSELVKENIEVLFTSSQNKNISIFNIIPNDIYINIDKYMINIVLRNLLSNAIKFTTEGGEISIGLQKNFENEFCVFVKDSGIGMTQDVIDTIFKIDKKTSKRGTNNEIGTGLGLILSKEFIEKHNGKLWVKSKPGEGSIFYFTLKID